MEYIAHERFKGIDLKGNPVLITRGKKLTRKEDFLYFKDRPICVYRSECAKRHFSKDDDKQGMVRGDLIDKIAYSGLSDEQIDLLFSDKWNHFLNLEHAVVIFNDSFFEAEVSELQSLYDDLKSIS